MPLKTQNGTIVQRGTIIAIAQNGLCFGKMVLFNSKSWISIPMHNRKSYILFPEKEKGLEESSELDFNIFAFTTVIYLSENFPTNSTQE